MEEKINNLTSLIIKDEEKEIAKDIIKVLIKHDLSLIEASRMLDKTKKVLPMIVTLKD